MGVSRLLTGAEDAQVKALPDGHSQAPGVSAVTESVLSVLRACFTYRNALRSCLSSPGVQQAAYLKPQVMVECWVGQKLAWSQDLAAVDCDLETRFLRCQQAELPFNLSVPDKGTVPPQLWFGRQPAGSCTALFLTAGQLCKARKSAGSSALSACLACLAVCCAAAS